MEYVCKVGTAAGDIIEQTFTAADETALRSDLEQKGYYLFSIRKGLRLEDLRLRRKRVAIPLLLIFGQELAALLKAGLPLLQSLDVMLERQKDPVFRASLSNIRERVKSGIALSEAFKTEGDLYPPILAASLVAGERSGSLEVVLRRFVQYLRLTQALKKKAISVSVYPIVLFTVMVTLVFVMLVYVIPQFQSFYEGLNAELPTPTRILMALSAAMREYVLWMVAGVAAAVVAMTVWLRQPGSAVRVDGLLLRLPYLGRLMRMYATSQLARTLSTLLAGGLPLLNALEVAGNSIGNRAMAAAVTRATPLIREGKSLTAALETTGMLENLTLEMVKVGEQTGALGDMLASVAEFYDEEVDTRLAAVLALVEPLMLVLMAFLVAGMLLAFYLPLFQAISAIQGGPR
jgi:type IV pilus assembly protein PilC